MTGPPTFKPKPKGCGRHTRYTGQGNAPSGTCPVCWRMYLEAKGVDADAVLAPSVVRVNDAAEIGVFVEDLRRATRASSHSGGLYSAFLHTKDGCFQVEVGLSKEG